MERIVHGHYADPNSTRDIVGITPVEFEFIIRCIQQHHIAMYKFAEASEEERINLVDQIKASLMFNEMGVTGEKLDEAASKMLQQFQEDYGISYEILKVINQPYPGADYGGPSPQNN
jgi:hypothetical protein